MIHRIDRILPDIDDRLIPPNAGRASLNLRFAASIADTDLAMTMIDGLAEIEYDIPDGDNLVIGANDRGNEGVFFALWNSNDNHGIYRILNEVVDLVIGGSILAFSETSDVDLRSLDGKLYWTDNVSQPRMVNIAKGVAGDYPDPLEEWMITLIKRPPGLYLETTVDKGNGYVSTDFKLLEASIDYDNDFPNESGFQFAYYYVYDNDEESRLSPVTPMNWWITLLKIRIPQAEFDAYLYNLNLVAQVVFCFRIGNDGVWYEIKRIANEPGNYVNDGGGNPGLQYLISDVTLLPKTAVSSDITGEDFDSVPLLATTLEVAQNRLNLANYLIDYPNWDGLTLTASAASQGNTDGINVNDKWRTHKPNSYYNVGVELLDEWGRKIGVVAQVQVFIPNYQTWEFQGDTSAIETASQWNRDQELNNYKIDYTLSGTFPSWAKYFRIVESKAIGVVQFEKTIATISYWYEADGVDVISPVWIGINYTNPNNPRTAFIFKGYRLDLTSGEPLSFATGDQLFVNIIGAYGQADILSQYKGVEYKIVKQSNNSFFFQLSTNILPDPPTAGFAMFDYVSPNWTYCDVEFVQKGASTDLYYQGTQVYDVDEGLPLSGSLLGDCYLSAFKKANQGSSKIEFYYPVPDVEWPSGSYQMNNTDPTSRPTYIIKGIFISENPTNIYSQVWSSDIGQPNVVNENQRQKRILQGIVFSNPLIQGTQVNGLSKFNSIDNRQAPLENGPITALVRTSATQREPGVLLAIGTNGVSSFYYDGIQLTNVDGTANVSTSDKYLASQRPLVGNFGASRLRNVCVTPLGTVYYWSDNIKDWIRYTNAGLEQLGEVYGFMNFLRGRLASSTSVMVTYDQVTDETILVGSSANAVVFSERYKTFQGSREYTQGEENASPERGASIATRTFFFLRGHIWQMGPGVAAANNSFFGEFKNPQLTIITNPEPTTLKRWNQIKVFGSRPVTCQINSGESEGFGLQSLILEGWWIERRGNWEAAIRRDENSEGSIMNGKTMECRILVSTFAWDAATFDKLNYLEIKATRSQTQ